MIVIVARKSSRCAACGGSIRKGEECYHSRAAGTRHVECASAPADQRVNVKGAPCSRCGEWVAPGEGLLKLVSEKPRPDGSYERTWSVAHREACGV